MERIFPHKVTTIASLAILIFAIFIHENAIASQQLLHETFEGGSWGVLGHGPTGGDSNGTSVTTENAFSGSWSAKVDYSGGKNLNHIWYGGLQPLIDRELYISFWFYYHPNWQHHYNHKVMRLTNSLSSFDTNNEFMTDGGEFFSKGIWHWQPNSKCGNPDNSWSNHLITKGAWHRWEFYGKLNSNGNHDGIIRVWIDHKLVKENTSWTWVAPGCNPQSSAYKWGVAYFPSNFADGPPAGSTPTYYIDEVEIWNGMPGDLLIPPTNLRIQ